MPNTIPPLSDAVTFRQRAEQYARVASEAAKVLALALKALDEHERGQDG
jgi:hypothetical protein